MVNLSLVQQYVIFLLERKCAYNELYKKKNMVGLISIGIWELSQVGAVKIVDEKKLNVQETSQSEFAHEFQKILFQMISETKPCNISYFVEKHVMNKSIFLKRYIKSIVDSLIDCHVLICYGENKKRTVFKVNELIQDRYDRKNSVCNYVQHRILFDNDKNRESQCKFDRAVVKYVDLFFDEYKYNKLEQIFFEIVAFFTGDVT